MAEIFNNGRVEIPVAQQTDAPAIPVTGTPTPSAEKIQVDLYEQKPEGNNIATILPDGTEVREIEVPSDVVSVIDRLEEKTNKYLRTLSDEDKKELRSAYDEFSRQVLREDLPVELRLYLSKMQETRAMYLTRPKADIEKLLEDSRSVLRFKDASDVREFAKNDPEGFKELINYLLHIKIPSKETELVEPLLTLEDLGYTRTFRPNVPGGQSWDVPKEGLPAGDYFDAVEGAIYQLKIFSALTGHDKEINGRSIDVDSAVYHSDVFKLAEELSKKTYYTGTGYAELGWVFAKGTGKAVWNIANDITWKMAYDTYRLLKDTGSDSEVQKLDRYQELMIKFSGDKSDLVASNMETVIIVLAVVWSIPTGGARTAAQETAAVANLGKLQRFLSGAGRVGKMTLDLAGVNVDLYKGVTVKLVRSSGNKAKLLVSKLRMSRFGEFVSGPTTKNLVPTEIEYSKELGKYLDENTKKVLDVDVTELRHPLDKDVVILKFNGTNVERPYYRDPKTGLLDELDYTYFHSTNQYYTKKTGFMDVTLVEPKELTDDLVRAQYKNKKNSPIIVKGPDGKVRFARRFFDNFSLGFDEYGRVVPAKHMRIAGTDNYIVHIGQKKGHSAAGSKLAVVKKADGRFVRVPEQDIDAIITAKRRGEGIQELKGVEVAPISSPVKEKARRGPISHGPQGYTQKLQIKFSNGETKIIPVSIEAESLEEFERKMAQFITSIKQLPPPLFRNVKHLRLFSNESGKYPRFSSDSFDGTYRYQNGQVSVYRGESMDVDRVTDVLRHEMGGHGSENLLNPIKRREFKERVLLAAARGGNDVELFYRKKLGGDYFQKNWRERFSEAMVLYLDPKTHAMMIEKDPFMTAVIEDALSGRIDGLSMEFIGRFKPALWTLALGLGSATGVGLIVHHN